MPNERDEAKQKYFGEFFDPTAEQADPNKVRAYGHWSKGFDAGYDAASAQHPPAPAVEAVYAVIFMNYFPRQVDSIWHAVEDAEKRADELGEGWCAEPWKIEGGSSHEQS